MSKNRIREPLIIVSAAFAILFALSFNKAPSFFGYPLKSFNLFSDIIKESPKNLQPDSNAIVKKDSVARNLSDIVDYKNDSALIRFFASLNKTKTGKHQTRIAYFGDSYIEGDLITQDFRAYMQNEFGGGGVGYVPITSVVAAFRHSVIHSFQGWKTYSFVNRPPDSHNLFISGYAFVPAVGDSLDSNKNNMVHFVKYAAVPYPHLNGFNTIKLFYGNSKGNNSANISGINYNLNLPGIFNQLEIKTRNSFKSVFADFKFGSRIDIYGMSLESDTGVIVDNFSFRGNTGLPMTSISPSMYMISNNSLDYDLIIIEYGLNAMSDKAKEYKWYEHGFANVVKYLKKCYPNTDILIIGVGDKARRVNGEYVEDPAVKQILTLQQNTAMQNRCAFWSLYDAMGGEGSMIHWADSTTALANKDYIHLNFRGGKQVGELLFQKLMKKYKTYKY